MNFLISKKDAKVCVRIQGSGRRPTFATVTTWGAMTNQILALCEHLLAEKVTCVMMEATGEYWKPYYYLLEDTLPVMLVNAHDARNMPGRKNGRLRRCLAGRPGRARAAARIARAAATDPPAA